MILNFSKNNILLIKMLYFLSLFSSLVLGFLEKGWEIFAISEAIFGLSAVYFFSKYTQNKALFRAYLAATILLFDEKFSVLSHVIYVMVILLEFLLWLKIGEIYHENE